MSTYHECPACLEYGRVRYSIMTAALAVRAQQTGETSRQILDRYMAGVHERHLSGLAILPGEQS